MKAYFKDLKNQTLTILKKLWTTKLGIASTSVAIAVVYLSSSLMLGEPRNPLWLAWWTLAGSLFFAVTSAAYQMHIKRLEQQLAANISNPPGFKYFVTTSDGANIGELDEVSYLTAKHEADTCVTTKLLQISNYVWVAYSIVIRTLVFMPMLLVSAALAYPFIVTDHSLSNITLGQVIESNMLFMVFQVTLVVTTMVSLIGGLRRAPGYKNYYELRLRRILSKHLPNIANARGFSVTGYRLDLTASTATTTTVTS